MDTTMAKLRDMLGGRLEFSPFVRSSFCQAPPGVAIHPPDAVATVKSEAEVVSVTRICYDSNIPIIASGARSSLEGQINAPKGGVCIDFSQMDEILSLSEADMTVKVQPGVTRERLNSYLRDTGLFFSVDPGANATIGGMAATRASGTNAVRYGTMAENVQAAHFVTADGKVNQIGSSAPKSAMGLDLLALAVGSEGTLGVFSELDIRLHAQPEFVVSGVCPFSTAEGAIKTVTNSLTLGIPIARIELLDTTAVRACNAYSRISLCESPHLFIEFHGERNVVDIDVKRFVEIANANDGTAILSSDLPERARLWKARHDAWWAFHAYYPGRKGLPTDVCVPRSRLSDCILETQEDIRISAIDAPLIGHVGDGNFHLLVMLEDGQRNAPYVTDFLQRLSERALACGGVVSGEHGVGQGKAKWMRRQHGTSLDIMRSIKSAMDPKNLFNPSKVYYTL